MDRVRRRRVRTGSRGGKARGGDAAVDETRFVGGVQPTRMGGVYRGTNAERHSGLTSGNGEAHRLARLRQGLKRAHNQIEHLVDIEQRERYREIVVERRAREAQVRRGELDPSSFRGGISVAGDYEGIMAARDRDAAATDDGPDAAEEERAYASLRGERWSLQSALVLHGTLGRVRESVPPPPSSSPGGHDDGWTDESLGAARTALRRRLDGPSVARLGRLCSAFVLLDAAAGRLGLGGGRARGALGTAAGWLAEYAARRDGVRVRGIPSSDARLSELNAGEHEIVLSAVPDGPDPEGSSGSSSRSSLSSELHRVRQSASLCSALLYLAAKRAGAGRTLAEVCGAFGTYSVRRRDGAAGGAVDREGRGEALVRPKFCGRAMSELRAAMPEAVVAPTPAPVGGLGSTGDLAASLPSAAPIKAEPPCCVSSASEASLNSAEAPSSSSFSVTTQEAALVDLVARMADSLGLPRQATLAAVAVAVRCVRDGRPPSASNSRPAAAASSVAGGSSGHIRPRRKRARNGPGASSVASADEPYSHESVAASSILLVCTAGGIMQRLARQALLASSSVGGADAAPPSPSVCDEGLEPSPLDGAEVDAPPGPEDGAEDDEDESAAPCEVVPPSANDGGHGTASRPTNENSTGGSGPDALSSWRAWNDEPPWDRPVPSLLRAAGLSRPGDLRAGAYGSRLHPDRARYLGAAAGDAASYARLVERDGGGGPYEDDGLVLESICVAAPLMTLRNL